MSTDTQTYQQTKLGAIPKEWEIKRLGDIGEFKNGINKSKEDFGFGVPFINLMNVFGKTEIVNKDLGLVNASETECKNYNLKIGDVLFIRSSVKPSGVGLTSLVPKDLMNVVYSGFLIRFRLLTADLDFNFKKYCFNEARFRNSLVCKSSISANTNINQESLKKLQIPLPPLPEQQKIAAILSTWDAAIASLEQLITAKEHHKKGLMQVLLTSPKDGQAGKKRFAGFSDEWDLKRLDEITKKITDGAHTSPKTSKIDKDYPIYSVKNMTDLNLSRSEPRYISKSDFNDLARQGCQPLRNDVLIAKDGSILKYSFVMKEDLKGVILSSIAIIRVDLTRLNPHYLVNYFKQDIVQTYVVKALTSGSGVPRIILRDFRSLKIPIPSLPEQQKIAAVLSAADTEIEQLKTQLTAIQHQKKGLMQKLLSGVVRVKIK